MRPFTSVIAAAVLVFAGLGAACSSSTDAPPASTDSPRQLAQAAAVVYASKRAVRNPGETTQGHVTIVWPDGSTHRIKTTGIEHPGTVYHNDKLYFADTEADYAYDGTLTRMKREMVDEKVVLGGTFAGPAGYDYVHIFNGPLESYGYTFTVSTRKTGEATPQTTVLRAALADLARCESGMYATVFDMDAPDAVGTQEFSKIELGSPAILKKLGTHTEKDNHMQIAIPVPCREDSVKFLASKGKRIDSTRTPNGVGWTPYVVRTWDTATGKLNDLPTVGFDSETYDKGSHYYDQFVGDGYLDVFTLGGKYWRIDTKTGKSRVLFSVTFKDPRDARRAVRLDGDTVTVLELGATGDTPRLDTYSVPDGAHVATLEVPVLSTDIRKGETDFQVITMPGLDRGSAATASAAQSK